MLCDTLVGMLLLLMLLLHTLISTMAQVGVDLNVMAAATVAV